MISGWFACVCALAAVVDGQGLKLSLSDLGGKGDGKYLNTHIIEGAVAQIGAAGGGTLVVPAGTWLTAPFNLTSHMTLYLGAGATLLATTNKSLWPVVRALPTYGVGRNGYPWSPLRHTSFIHGESLENVTITGDSGVIDSQGHVWWTYQPPNTITPGSLAEFMYSRNIKVSHVHLVNSPFWTLHLYFCDHAHVHDLEIAAPEWTSGFTDGVDCDSSNDVLIENYRYHAGDDAVALKSGWDCFGNDPKRRRPTTNIVVRNVTALSPSAGLAIGSEMSGGIENVTVRDSSFNGSSRGEGMVYIKTSWTRGGYVRNAHFENLTIGNAAIGIGIGETYGEPNHGCPTHPQVPSPVSNISFEGIYQQPGTHVKQAASFMGRPDSPIVGLRLKGVHLNASDSNMSCAHLQEATAEDVTPQPCAAFAPSSATVFV